MAVVMYLSVIVPVFNEEGSIELLHQKLTSVLAGLEKSYEILFVDDGSTDESPSVLERVFLNDNHVKVLQFRGNFGKSAALMTGFAKAKGEILITMDADLQDDPAEIPRFVDRLNEGYDLVVGWKKIRKDPVSKTIPSKAINKVVRMVTHLDLHDINCGFKAFRKEVVRGLDLYGDLFRYMAVLVSSKGYRVSEIVVKHHPRSHGKSKFGGGRFIRGFFDLFTILFLTRYLQRPLHIFGVIGGSLFTTGICINVYLTVIRLGGGLIGNRPLLMLGVLLMLLGMQILLFGIVGDMVTNLKNSLGNKDNTEQLVAKEWVHLMAPEERG